MKQAVVAIAVGGLLVAGGTIAGLTLTQGTSLADNSSSCLANLGSGAQCTILDDSIQSPSQIYAQLESPSGTKSLYANLTWSVSCPSTATAVAGSRVSAAVPSTVYLQQSINIASTATCTVTIKVQVTGFKTDTDDISLLLNYSPGTGTGGTSTTPAPAPSSSVPSGGVSGPIKGFDSKCVNDSGNSYKLRAAVVSYACSGAKGKTWRYAAGELIHNGLCLNDKGNAGNGGKVILYSCNGSADELWVHQLNNTYELKAHNWTLCLTIPNSSKKNGVQLQANTCHNGANQHWTVP
jgi:hypothetical protein